MTRYVFLQARQVIWSEQLDIIWILVNFSCGSGPIMIKYDLLEAIQLILSKHYLPQFTCKVDQKCNYVNFESVGIFI